MSHNIKTNTARFCALRMMVADPYAKNGDLLKTPRQLPIEHVTEAFMNLIHDGGYTVDYALSIIDNNYRFTTREPGTTNTPSEGEGWERMTNWSEYTRMLFTMIEFMYEGVTALDLLKEAGQEVLGS